MASLGELFISLGFDVDDTKLKAFKNAIRDTHEDMAKLGRTAAEALGVITTAAAGLALFVQHSADGATKLGNMALMFGANAQAAQTFANALHQVNSVVSVSSGIDMFGKFSRIVKGEIPLGAGGADAVALLGGYKPGEGFLGTSADDVIRRFAQNYAVMKKQFGAGYGVFLDKAGLGAAAEPAIAELASNPSRYEAASQYNMTQDQIAALKEYAQSTAEFHEAITRFENTVAAHLAPALTQFFNAITAILDRLPSADAVGDRLLAEKEKRDQEGFFQYWIGDMYDVMTGSKQLGPFFGNGSGTRGARNNNPGNIKYGPFAQAHGATGSDDRGFAIFPESGMGMAAISYLLRAYAGQHINTIHGIVGRYTSGDSPSIQAAYERMLETTTGRGAGEHLNISDPNVLRQLVAGIIRQENGSKNVTINVHSNATDNNEVAKLVADHFQNRILNPTNAQTNLGY